MHVFDCGRWTSGKSEFCRVRRRLNGADRASDGRETATGSLQGRPGLRRRGAAACRRPRSSLALQASGGRFSAVRGPFFTGQTLTDGEKFGLSSGVVPLALSYLIPDLIPPDSKRQWGYRQRLLSHSHLFFHVTPQC